MKIGLKAAAMLLFIPTLASACAPASSGSFDETPSVDSVPDSSDATAPTAPEGSELVGSVQPAPSIPQAPQAPMPPSAPQAPPQAGAFPGDVAPGHVRWGAAINGNGDPVARHESSANATMGLRRTYFAWKDRANKMVNVAAVDLAANRLPWVSIKTPLWTDMASGRHDAEIDEMIRALNNLNGPVWLTVHHEPEGGGGTPGPDQASGAAGWTAMQRRVRQRLDAVGTSNIAFAPILMSWTFDSRSGRNPADWWVDGIWDFVGVDHYEEKEARTTVESNMWNSARAFYSTKGIKMAVGEWGNRGSDASAAAEMHDFYNTAIASGSQKPQNQIIGLAYFDSNLNSTNGGWELLGQPLAKFRDLMKPSTSLTARQTGY